MGEYVPYQELPGIIEKEKHAGKRVVLTGGVFDIVHPAHLYLFEIARGLGDILVVNVVNDKRVRYYKGSERPLNPEMQRAQVISGYEWVNYATIHPDFEKGPTIELSLLIKPYIIVRGERGWEDAERERLRKLLNYNVELRSIGRIDTNISTTSIIEKIKKGL